MKKFTPAVLPTDGIEHLRYPRAEIFELTELHEETLPWNGTKVNSTGNISGAISRCLPEFGQRFLPESITILAEPEITRAEIKQFIDHMVDYLENEFKTRHERSCIFVARGLISEPQMVEFLMGQRNLQPWKIVLNRDGGLGNYNEEAFRKELNCGLAPCRAMKNHGLAWERTSPNHRHHVSLVTARQHGSDWDMDSDIGHESSHAAFAPVPLFTTPAAGIVEQSGSQTLESTADPRMAKTRSNLAGVCYRLAELAVVGLRAEKRETMTGVPALEGEQPGDFAAFLRLSHELMPTLGFDRALCAFEKAGEVIDPMGPEMYDICAPALKAELALREMVYNTFDVPTVGQFLTASAALGDPENISAPSSSTIEFQ